MRFFLIFALSFVSFPFAPVKAFSNELTEIAQKEASVIMSTHWDKLSQTERGQLLSLMTKELTQKKIFLLYNEGRGGQEKEVTDSVTEDIMKSLFFLLDDDDVVKTAKGLIQSLPTAPIVSFLTSLTTQSFIKQREKLLLLLSKEQLFAVLPQIDKKIIESVLKEEIGITIRSVIVEMAFKNCGKKKATRRTSPTTKAKRQPPKEDCKDPSKSVCREPQIDVKEKTYIP
jgi:hypothetical protein